MKRRRLPTAVVTAVAALAAISGAAAVANASTTAAPAAPAGRVTVSAAPAWVSQASKVATVPARSTVQLTITLPSRNAAAARAFAQSVSKPGSRNFRHFLTPAQYNNRFGPTASAIRRVRSWLAGEGFKITHQGIGYLRVSGPAKDAETAFGTGLSTFKRNGQTVMAPTSAVTVPAALRSSVQSVLGLDTSATFHSDIATQAQLVSKVAKLAGVKLPKNFSTAADGGATETGGCASYWGQTATPYLPAAPAPLNKAEPDENCGYTPQQLDAARGVTSTHLTGRGVTAGIVLWCEAPNLVSDVNQWATDVHVPLLKPGQLTIDQPSQPYQPYCDNYGTPQLETTLDAEAIHAVAPGANIIYAPGVGPNDAGIIGALQTLVDNGTVNIINNSYSELESDLTPDVEAAYETVLTQAADEGITVVASAGDGSDNFASGPIAADYPASDPWVTSVGGTSLGLTKSNHVAFEEGWFTELKLYAGLENGWNSQWVYAYGGGGGTSALFAQPSYQQGVVPASLAGSTPMRVYPDLANVADPSTGFLMGWTDPFFGNFDMLSVGGTSVSSPVTVGQIALAIQKNGGPLGFLNPVIYQRGSKYLTDLRSNTVNEGVQLAELIPEVYAAVPAAVTINGQSLASGTTLSLAPGYDNMSGMGVPSNEAKFISLLDSPS